jgi:hypothetical protein
VGFFCFVKSHTNLPSTLNHRNVLRKNPVLFSVAGRMVPLAKSAREHSGQQWNVGGVAWFFPFVCPALVGRYGCRPLRADVRVAASTETARSVFSLIANICRIIGKDIDLGAPVFVVHVAFAAFSRKYDPVTSRPVVIAAVPLDIQ